jgi:hypothetical protein
VSRSISIPSSTATTGFRTSKLTIFAQKAILNAHTMGKVARPIDGSSARRNQQLNHSATTCALKPRTLIHSSRLCRLSMMLQASWTTRESQSGTWLAVIIQRYVAFLIRMMRIIRMYCIDFVRPCRKQRIVSFDRVRSSKFQPVVLTESVSRRDTRRNEIRGHRYVVSF